MIIILINVKKRINVTLQTFKHFAMSKKECTFAPVFVEKNEDNKQITKQ